ncbi:hypothetical protein HY488_03125 [Candidatus Woesearchaeota archaeon]|nr:hypothetical protein [Candidatus Woesearchaeota archaeon]
MTDVQHNCGLCVAHSLDETYSLMEQLQHRGREAAGIAAISDDKIDVVKWQGRVESFGRVGLYRLFGDPKYHTFMGHVRYATRGRKDKILEDAHPHVIGGKIEHRGSHILISDCDMAIVHNGQVDESNFQGLEKSLFQTTCDTERLIHLFWQRGEYDLMKQINGAFTLAIADKRRKEILVLRDRTGIKPGVLGKKSGKYGVASEDIAFTENKGDFIEDLEPGHIYYLAPDGGYRKENVIASQPRHCFFEYTYIANRESNLNRLSVRHLREALGEMLALEFRPPDADFVTFLPNCPETAARYYARVAGLAFEEIFYKVKDERAFQGSSAADRASSIKANLYILPKALEVLPGKTAIVIDDSTIRGNNASWAKQLMLDAGAKKVYLANYIPPVGIIGTDNVPRGCMFGVDMPPNPSPGEEFIARGRSLEQISETLGMGMAYLSLDGMLQTFEKLGMPRQNLCYYCVGGEHPFNGL